MSFKSHKELFEALITKKTLIDAYGNTLVLDKEYKLTGNFKSYEPELHAKSITKHYLFFLLNFLNPTNWSFKNTQLINGIEIGIPSTLKDFKKGDLYYAVSSLNGLYFTEVIGDCPIKDNLYFNLSVCFADKKDAEDYIKAINTVKEPAQPVQVSIELVDDLVEQDRNVKARYVRQESILKLFETIPIRTVSNMVHSKKQQLCKPPYIFDLTADEAKLLLEKDILDLVNSGKLIVNNLNRKSIPTYRVNLD